MLYKKTAAFKITMFLL